MKKKIVIDSGERDENHEEYEYNWAITDGTKAREFRPDTSGWYMIRALWEAYYLDNACDEAIVPPEDEFWYNIASALLEWPEGTYTSAVPITEARRQKILGKYQYILRCWGQ